MTGRRATRPPRSGPADAPMSEAQARYVAAQQRIAASAADERRRRRERRPRVRDRWVSSLLLSAVVGISTSGWLLTRIDLPDSAASTTDDRPSLPEFDEELAEPDSYRVTFRGPSYLSPSPWFEAVRGAGSDSIVVDIDQDGPGAMASIALLVRREGSWYLDLDAGVTRGQASSDGTTWVGYDDATRLRTFSEVTTGAVADHLTLVDDQPSEGPARRGAHGLHTYDFDLDRDGFCAGDRYSCDAWFRSFGLSADDPTDTPLALEAPVPSGRVVTFERRPTAPIAIETDDTSPDRDAADGMLLLRLTVDEDGLLWDIELRQPQGRVFWISVDEFSKDPFSPPTPVS